MATIRNSRDSILSTATYRLNYISNDFVLISGRTNTITTTASGTTPTTIELTAILNGNLRGTVVWSGLTGTVNPTDGNKFTISASSIPAGGSANIVATLTYLNRTYTDTYTISHIAEGLVTRLSKYASVVATASDGTGGNFSSVTSTMFVQFGATDDSANWTYTWTVPAGVTATGQSTATITVSQMTVDSADLICTASRSGYVNQTQRFTVTKAKAGTQGAAGVNGADGTDGTDGTDGISAISVTNSVPAIALQSASDGTITTTSGSGTSIQVLEGSNVLTYRKIVTTYPAPSVVSSIGTSFDASTSGTINMPSSLQNGDLLYVYVSSDAATNVTTTTPGWSRVLSIGSPSTPENYAYLFTATYSGTLAALTLNGMSTATVALAVAVRGSGTPGTATTFGTGTAPNPASISTTVENSLVIAFAGIDDLVTTSVTPPAGYTPITNGASNFVTSAGTTTGTKATAMGAYKTVAVAGTEDPGTFTHSPATSENWTSVTIRFPSIASTPAIQPGEYDISASYTPNGTNPITLGTITGNTTTTVTVGDFTANAGSKTVDAYTISYSITGKRLDGSNFTAQTKQQITKAKAGSDAILLRLTSETDAISANNDGTGYTLPTGNSLTLFSGGIAIASGVTYGPASTTKNGLTLAVNTTTGAITLSPNTSGWTSNTESFTLTATYNSIVYNIIYTISKTRVGNTGTTGATGPRAPVHAYADAREWTDAVANTAIQIQTGGSPILGDRVTIYTEPKWLPFKGLYSSSVVYLKGDVVRHTDNVLYRLIVDSATGVTPVVGTTWVGVATPTGPSQTSSSYINRGNWAIGTAYAINDVVNFTKILSTTNQVLAIPYKLNITGGNAASDFLSYTETAVNLSVGDAVILSSIVNITGLTANTIYYVASIGSGQLKLSASSTLTPVVDITNVGSPASCVVNKITPQEFYCVAAHTQTATGTASTDDAYTFADFVQGAAVTKSFASGAWTSVVAYFDGNVIITGTLSVDTLKSGSATVGNTRGTFGLGGTDVLFNRQATGRFTSDNTASVPLFAMNSRTHPTEWCNGLISANLAVNGYAFVAYNAKNTSSNTYRSIFGGGAAYSSLFARKFLEGNILNTSNLIANEDNGEAWATHTEFGEEDRAQRTEFYVEYTKVFNQLNDGEVVATSGSSNIYILNHSLQVNQAIKFFFFTSGTNFVVGREYWVKSIIDANNITVYPVGSSSTTPALTFDGTAAGTIQAHVRERVVRRATLTNASPTITTTARHNLFPDALIKFTNVIGGTNFNTGQWYRVKTIVSATQFTVYYWYDTVNKTQITFDGTTTTAGVVIGLSPVRTRAYVGTENSAGIFTLFTNHQINQVVNTEIATVRPDTGQFFSIYSTGTGSQVYSAGGFTPFTGQHVVVIEKQESIELGDIVCDNELLVKRDISNTIVKVTQSTTNQQKGVVGVVALLECGGPEEIVAYKDTLTPQEYTTPNIVQEPVYAPVYQCTETEKFITINALGEGQINVCGLGGNIEIGDLIVSSTIPGKGMKQSDDLIRNYTVAKSRETVTFDYPEQVKQIACIYLGG